ncbi:Signal peptidase complex subunit 2 [Plasmodiophora brassicae]|uniref:Signal peptidase complex subunit 2 n=1 Tax=Plasmodiophora brassicae TaxID=37360 RepID=A0A0G4J4U6_PLABS|nr:hypothetical protein PBRA_002570 [Plasmodiophora brassicae]
MASADDNVVPPLDLTDTLAIKHVLDDQAVLFITQKGYEEDYVPFALNSVISVIAVVLAVVGHFLEFPGKRMYVILCVAGFAVCVGLLNFLKMHYGKNCLLSTKPRTSRTPDQIQQLGKVAPGLSLSSEMPRLQPMYTVSICSRPYAQATKVLEPITKELSVFEFFTVDGQFLQVKFFDRLNEVLELYHASASKKTK